MMKQGLNGGGYFLKARKALIVFLSIFMLAFGTFFLTACDGDSSSEFYVLLLDEDETTVLYNEKIESGEKIADVPTPTKEADEQYTYTFAGWVDENGSKVVLSFATSNITAHATYTATQREYSLTILSNEQELYSYDKVQVLRDGTYLTTGSVLHYGDELTIDVIGSNGYSHEDGDISYRGLDLVSAEDGTYYVVRGDVTISYTETAKYYTVKFLDSDGTEKYSTMVTYGSSVEYPYSVPTKAEDDTGSYTFSGWVDSTSDDAEYVDLTRITATTTVYAKYSITYKEYLLTIDTNADVVVYKNGTAISSGQTVHYGDILTIEATPNEGYEISTLQANGTNITGNALTVRGETTITCTQTICEYSVVLYDEDKVTLLYSEVIEWNANAVVTETPTKDADEKYSYTFAGWVDASGKLISSTLIIYNVKENITAYASYGEEYIPYTLTLSDYVAVTLDDSTQVTNENGTITVHYGDVLTISSSNLPTNYSIYKFVVNESSDNLTVSGTYTVSGDTTLTAYLDRTFVTEKFTSDLEVFSAFVNAASEQLGSSDDYVESDAYVLWTYVGKIDLGEVTAKYVDITMDALVFTSAYDTAQELSTPTTTHDSGYDASMHTWTSQSSWYYQDYITTPLYEGMSIEFTLTGEFKSFLFGLSPEEEFSDPASYVWSTYTASADKNYNNFYIPKYNVFSSQSTSYKYLRWLTQNSATASGNLGTAKNTDALAFRTDNSTSDIVYNYGTTVTVKLVLEDTVKFYITDEDGDTITVGTSTWGIDSSTAYYFSIMSVTSLTMTLNSFGYETSTYETAFLKSVSGEKISFFGDSITKGEMGTSASYVMINKTSTTCDSSATYYTYDSEEDTYTSVTGLESFDADTAYYTYNKKTDNRYATVLSNALGMTEENLGINSTTYCTGIDSTHYSRIDDVEDISTDSKIVIVFLGINDFSTATADGKANLGELGSTDTTTIYGATNVMYSAIAERFQGTDTKIYVCTPAPSRADTLSKVTNSAGYTIQDLSDVITEVAELFGFGVIDLYGEIDWSYDDYDDALHPNNTGHKMIADYIYRYLLKEYILSVV